MIVLIVFTVISALGFLFLFVITTVVTCVDRWIPIATIVLEHVPCGRFASTLPCQPIQRRYMTDFMLTILVKSLTQQY